jgi:hypothetical protein
MLLITLVAVGGCPFEEVEVLGGADGTLAVAAADATGCAYNGVAIAATKKAFRTIAIQSGCRPARMEKTALRCFTDCSLRMSLIASHFTVSERP